ncbi:MAG: hypothetical protein IPJ95_02585 [Gemmatimonadetes bacterium]|nr:hypothetical protein [Gemmatimonadota bacterium]
MPRTDLAGLVPWRARAVLLATLLAACGGGDGGGSGPAGSGHLAVAVSGLPAGAAARVTVTGPNGYDKDLSASAMLNGLQEGTYRVSTGYVNAQAQTWTASAAPDSVVVADGDTAQVAVAYTGGPATTVNLTVAGTQLIQSSQRADGSIPMVGGRDAMLRVFVVASGANGAQPAVRVRLYQGGTPVDSLLVAAPLVQVPQAPDTATLSKSWNVLIPGARVLAGLSYQVEVDPGDAVPETSESDNRWPGGAGTQAVTVQNVPPFTVRFVPVKQSVNDLTGTVNAGNKAAFIETTRRMFPLGQVTADVRTTYTTDAPVYQANDGNNGWGQTLGEVGALRATDGSTSHYVGIIQVTYGGGIAGLGYIGAPASISWDKVSSAPGVIAHELGHNFGRNHAPCGNPSGPDPGYPYANATIGSWGLDLTGLTLKSPSGFVDLMSYCDPDWVSDYTYSAILAWRGTAPDQQGAGPHRYHRRPGPAAVGPHRGGERDPGAVVRGAGAGAAAGPPGPAPGGGARCAGPADLRPELRRRRRPRPAQRRGGALRLRGAAERRRGGAPGEPPAGGARTHRAPGARGAAPRRRRRRRSRAHHRAGQRHPRPALERRLPDGAGA